MIEDKLERKSLVAITELLTLDIELFEAWIPSPVEHLTIKDLVKG